jgi:hypothetical protein
MVVLEQLYLMDARAAGELAPPTFLPNTSQHTKSVSRLPKRTVASLKYQQHLHSLHSCPSLLYTAGSC